jgi:hypothetical protein
MPCQLHIFYSVEDLTEKFTSTGFLGRQWKYSKQDVCVFVCFTSETSVQIWTKFYIRIKH